MRGFVKRLVRLTAHSPDQRKSLKNDWSCSLWQMTLVLHNFSPWLYRVPLAAALVSSVWPMWVSDSMVCAFTTHSGQCRGTRQGLSVKLSSLSSVLLEPRVHTNHLGILIKCRFSPRRSAVGPGIRHFHRLPGNAETAGSGPHFEYWGFNWQLLSSLGSSAYHKDIGKTWLPWHVLLFTFLFIIKDGWFNTAFDTHITLKGIDSCLLFLSFKLGAEVSRWALS